MHCRMSGGVAHAELLTHPPKISLDPFQAFSSVMCYLILLVFVETEPYIQDGRTFRKALAVLETKRYTSCASGVTNTERFFLCFFVIQDGRTFQ